MQQLSRGDALLQGRILEAALLHGAEIHTRAKPVCSRRTADHSPANVMTGVSVSL
jgi:hypothetical protein